jgi:hypothetical protein
METKKFLVIDTHTNHAIPYDSEDLAIRAAEEFCRETKREYVVVEYLATIIPTFGDDPMAITGVYG